MFLARAASIASNASTTEHDELPTEGSAPTGCAELDLLLTSAERAIVHTTPGRARARVGAGGRGGSR